MADRRSLARAPHQNVGAPHQNVAVLVIELCEVSTLRRIWGQDIQMQVKFSILSGNGKNAILETVKIIEACPVRCPDLMPKLDNVTI